ncbi:MAG: hypothetical protein SF182_09310 [Deltaproteobacteria bacterium]|nr:hypothetical protein [Deltaproteobacteria bacterium]
MSEGPTCWRCGAAFDARQPVGRRAACLACGNDLRCCRNCARYAPAMHNQCREPQAERQVDKERGNFCDWFSPGAAAPAAADPAAAARAKLDRLFRR